MPVVSLTFFVVCLFIALVVGAVLGGFITSIASIARGRASAATDPAQAQAAFQAELQAVRAAANAAQMELARELAQMRERASRVGALEGETTRLSSLLDTVREQAAEQRESSGRRISQLSAELTAERETSGEKLRVLQDAKLALSDQFKTLASDILEEKSKRFAEQNQHHLGTLLDPLRTQLSEFKGKVEEVYVQEGKDRSALSEQVRQLMALNQTLSRDASNLTKALKGSAKTQGNWGELILERVLEASGLRKGHEYHVQDSQRTDEGRLLQPDVVIHLPEQRKLVVDAKVSLVAYERFVSAESDDERTAAGRLHLESVRTHVKGLSGKSYQKLYGLKSLDFVLMFVPIEPAFMLAVTHDDALFMEAWERNILLVSPSTLLFVVRTVAHLWRQEAQSKNAQDIAKRGAELYDKLAGFVADLERVGDKLGDARKAYEDAHSKLASGRGNVIRQAEMLVGLGVKPTKALPAALVEAARAGEATDGTTDDQPEDAPPLAKLPSPFDSPAADRPAT